LRLNRKRIPQLLCILGLLNLGKMEPFPFQFYELPVFMLFGAIGGMLGALWNHINYRLSVFRIRYLLSYIHIEVSALRRAIAEFKQRWSVIGWVSKNLLSRVPPTCLPCFGRHVEPLVPAAFAVVRIHQSALGPCGGLRPVLLMYHP
jgi:hypothetical protein